MIVKNANPYLLDALWEKKNFIVIQRDNYNSARGFTIPIERILVIYDINMIVDNRDFQVNFGHTGPFLKFVVKHIEPSGNIFTESSFFDIAPDPYKDEIDNYNINTIIDEELRELTFQASQENICTYGSSHHFFPYLQDEENLTDEEYKDLLEKSPIFEHPYPIDDPVFDFIKRSIENNQNRKDPTGFDNRVVTKLPSSSFHALPVKTTECGCENCNGTSLESANIGPSSNNINDRLREFFRILQRNQMKSED